MFSITVSDRVHNGAFLVANDPQMTESFSFKGHCDLTLLHICECLLNAAAQLLADSNEKQPFVTVCRTLLMKAEQSHHWTPLHLAMKNANIELVLSIFGAIKQSLPCQQSFGRQAHELINEL